MLEIQKRPAWLLGAVAAVALLAWLASRNDQPQVIDASYAGGGAARAIDPNAAAIEEAAISAGHANLETIASLVGLEDSNQSALTSALAQTEAQRTASLAQTDASFRSALAQTDAQERAALASIAASQEISNYQTSANVTISQGQTAAQVEAARINANAAAAATAANAATEQARIQAEHDNAVNANQTAKDVARAKDNTDIITNIIHGIESGLMFFFG